jgi:adenylate kinase family enzyme
MTQEILQEDDENMVKVTSGGQTFYLDGILKSNLDIIKRDVLKKDWDGVFIITGMEGVGKTTIATQICKYLDPTFGLDDCHFQTKEFKEGIYGASKGKAVLLDESQKNFSSRGALSKFNKELIGTLSECRSRNLFIVLNIPSFWELDKYPAIHRSLILIHCHKRGSFMVYNYEKKKKLYLMGKKGYEFCVGADFYGRYVKYFALPKEEYEAKKQKNIRESQEAKTREDKLIEQRNLLIKYVFDHNMLSVEDIATHIGVTDRHIRRILDTT